MKDKTYDDQQSQVINTIVGSFTGGGETIQDRKKTSLIGMINQFHGREETSEKMPRITFTNKDFKGGEAAQKSSGEENWHIVS